MLHSELLDGINGSADLIDALLQQSIYNEVYCMVVSEYFNLHVTYNNEPMAISTVLTEDELNAIDICLWLCSNCCLRSMK